jgi:hypothetical protein
MCGRIGHIWWQRGASPRPSPGQALEFSEHVLDFMALPEEGFVIVEGTFSVFWLGMHGVMPRSVSSCRNQV